jgi:glycosyltransferase involved in cell wall biosynthesis
LCPIGVVAKCRNPQGPAGFHAKLTHIDLYFCSSLASSPPHPITHPHPPFTTLSGFTYEIIVVDDGSRDRTCAVVQSYVKKYGTDTVRLLKLFRNHGKGGAVRKGMLRARGQFMLMVDADGATQFSDMDRLLEELQGCHAASGDCIVVGSRAHMMKEASAKRKWYVVVVKRGANKMSDHTAADLDD